MNDGSLRGTHTSSYRIASRPNCVAHGSLQRFKTSRRIQPEVTATTVVANPPSDGFYSVSGSDRTMSSTRVYASASLGLRLFVLLLVIVSMILIMTAPGVCFWRTINGAQSSREICPPSNSLFPMNIDRWNSALHFQMRGQNVWGQLAIIILSILFALVPIVFSCVYFTSGRHLVVSQVIAAAVCVIAFLVFGAVETWYATGFDHMSVFIRQIGGGTFSGCAGIPGCETGFLVRGWAAAAAFYFLAAVLFLVDAVLAFLMKSK